MTRAPDPLRLIIIAAVLAVVGIRTAYWLRNDLAYRMPPQPKGTGAISGIVVDDDGRPIAGASVGLSRQDEVPVWRNGTSHDDGTFVFDGLPAGTYEVDAHLRGITVNRYSMTGVGMGRLSAALADGQRRAGVTIRVARGGAIEGVVYDEQGRPAAKCYVRAMRRDRIFDEPRFNALSIASTDAQGHYRVTGAPPGEYFLMAALDASANRRVYYPSAARIADAKPVTLTFGQERAHVDLHAQAVPMAPIGGTVRRPDGAPAVLVVDLIRAGEPEPDHRHLLAISQADGRFAFPAVPADRYWIVAHSAMTRRSGAEPRDGTPSESLLWGIVEVTSDGRHPADVQVPVAPGRTITGAIKFQALTDTPRPKTVDLTVRLVGRDERSTAQLRAGTVLSTVNANGDFSISGVPPGVYSFGASYFRDWWVESMEVDGHPVPDGTIAVARDRDAGGLTILLTDRPSTLTGTVRNAKGAPLAGRTVVVFARDARSWTWATGRVRAAGSNLDGEFSVFGLVAGDYLVVALDEGRADRWHDRKALETLRAGAVPLALGTGERKTLDLVTKR